MKKGLKTKMEIRSITIHLLPNEWSPSSLRKEIEEALVSLSQYKDFIRSESGLDVWSLRISLPKLPERVDIKEITEVILNNIEKDVLVSGFILGSNDKRIQDLFYTLEKGIFSSIILENEQHLIHIVDFIRRVAERDPLATTRIGIELTGHRLLTPYFPLSRHEGKLKKYFTLALLYTDELYGAKNIMRFSERLAEIARSIKTILNYDIIPVRGIDYSLSPWMEHSVARVIEEIGGCKLGEIGCHYSIYLINKYLSEIASKYNGIGFNEVMLPLAEDDLLKQRVYEGSLEAKDLLSYSNICLVGPDMIPLSTSKEKLTRFYLDSFAIAKMKNRPMGIRIIPLSENYNDENIDLGIFGKTPVLKI